MRDRNKKMKVRLNARGRKLRHAEAMLKTAEARARRAQKLLAQWQEKVRLLESERKGETSAIAMEIRPPSLHEVDGFE